MPGDPGTSLLIQLVKHTDPKQRMPMGNKLKDADIDALTEWVKAGAVWPKTDSAKTAPAANKSGEYVIHEAQRKHWSFQPLTQPARPAVKDARWPQDRYRPVRPGAAREGRLAPVRPAAKRDLIRRATLDLTGLPPTPKRSTPSKRTPRRTRSPKSSIACSPRRTTASAGAASGSTSRATAKTTTAASIPMRRGYNPYPNAYLYRDWVIKAFNDDLPYDHFVKAQLAGDLLDEQDRAQARCRRSASSGSARGTTTTARSRSRAPTSGTIASTSCRAASSADRRLRPLPRPQVRSDSAERLLLAGRRVPEHAVSTSTRSRRRPSWTSTQRIEERSRGRKKLMGEMQQNLERRSSSQTLALQTVEVHAGGVEGDRRPQRRKRPQVVDARSSTTSCSIAGSLPGKAAEVLSVPEDVAGDDQGRRHRARKRRRSPTSSRTAVVDVMLARKEINEENEIIAAKALRGTKKKKRANKPERLRHQRRLLPRLRPRASKRLPEDGTSSGPTSSSAIWMPKIRPP